MEKSVILQDADPVSRRALEKTLKKEGFADFCQIQADETAVSDGSLCIRLGMAEGPGHNIFIFDDFKKPVRIGALLDHVKKSLIKMNNPQDLVSFGTYTLNRFNHELLNKTNGQTIRLTEKESQILGLLARQAGEIVSRKALLDSVWGYADGIETHTLETHIYRLRQKIETDPANPVLLLTEEAGYRLKYL